MFQRGPDRVRRTWDVLLCGHEALGLGLGYLLTIQKLSGKWIRPSNNNAPGCLPSIVGEFLLVSALECEWPRGTVDRIRLRPSVGPTQTTRCTCTVHAL